MIGDGIPSNVFLYSFQRRELAVFRDLHAGSEVLGLQYVEIHPAVDQQMVDLGDAPAVFQPQVVDDRPIARIGRIRSR
jgi:alpha-D-ribose 1-methylphosphonate 5-triphosphate synthase subunit PhnI